MYTIGMKLIIIIQTLIIIAGGYYVYLLNNPKEIISETPAPVLTIPTDTPKIREGYTPPTSNPPIDPADSSSTVTGHSDVGMEFPTPDEGLQVQ